MKTSDFDYELPESAIAQTPVEPRDSVLVLHRVRATGAPELPREGYLRPADLLVLNQTRVIPGRLFARKPTGGRVELLLLRRLDPVTWDALIGGKGMIQHRHAQVEGGPGFAVLEVLDGAERRIRFEQPIEPYLPRLGHVPLPPYIHAELQDPERYQTVYARDPGSAAAPTAGLHFTPQLLDTLKAQGVEIATVTLHVGLDTFAPVTETTRGTSSREWCRLTRRLRIHPGLLLGVASSQLGLRR
jgi:S-adenosylmethionine:tRNA ribosyltransferase-isomerase